MIDEDSGAVLGELSHSLELKEDPSLSLKHQGIHKKEPVVVDFSNSDSKTHPVGLVTVTPVSSWIPSSNPPLLEILSVEELSLERR